MYLQGIIFNHEQKVGSSRLVVVMTPHIIFHCSCHSHMNAHDFLFGVSL